MKYVLLTQGKKAIVDDEDYDRVSKLKWQYHTGGYAKSGVKTIRLHRFILNAPPNLEVDHINGNKLDCRKSNIRLCSRKQNVRSVPKRKDTTNKYKGTHFLKHRNKWISRIQIDGKRINSGYFNTEKEAAERYNSLAKRFFGDYAKLNIILDNDKK